MTKLNRRRKEKGRLHKNDLTSEFIEVFSDYLITQFFN